MPRIITGVLPMTPRRTVRGGCACMSASVGCRSVVRHSAQRVVEEVTRHKHRLLLIRQIVHMEPPPTALSPFALASLPSQCTTYFGTKLFPVR
jgi:hypothetical protein